MLRNRWHLNNVKKQITLHFAQLQQGRPSNEVRGMIKFAACSRRSLSCASTTWRHMKKPGRRGWRRLSQSCCRSRGRPTNTRDVTVLQFEQLRAQQRGRPSNEVRGMTKFAACSCRNLSCASTTWRHMKKPGRRGWRRLSQSCCRSRGRPTNTCDVMVLQFEQLRAQQLGRPSNEVRGMTKFAACSCRNLSCASTTWRHMKKPGRRGWRRLSQSCCRSRGRPTNTCDVMVLQFEQLRAQQRGPPSNEVRGMTKFAGICPVPARRGGT